MTVINNPVRPDDDPGKHLEKHQTQVCQDLPKSNWFDLKLHDQNDELHNDQREQCDNSCDDLQEGSLGFLNKFMFVFTWSGLWGAL